MSEDQIHPTSDEVAELNAEICRGLQVPQQLLEEPCSDSAAAEAVLREEAARGISRILRSQIVAGYFMPTSRDYLMSPDLEYIFGVFKQAASLGFCGLDDERWDRLKDMRSKICRAHRRPDIAAWIMTLRKEDMETSEAPTEEQLQQKVLIFRIPDDHPFHGQIKAMQEEDKQARKVVQDTAMDVEAIIAAGANGEILAIGGGRQGAWPQKVWKPSKLRLRDNATPLWEPRRGTPGGDKMYRRLRMYNTLTDARIRGLIGCAFGLKLGVKFYPVAVMQSADAGWVFVFPMHIQAFEIAKKYGLVYVPAPNKEPDAAGAATAATEAPVQP